jgi:hypothetical protein
MQCFFGSSAILGPESKAILVTHFRKPIDRINSEYWSEGPGNTLHISEESTWKDWFAASEMRHQSIGSGYEPGIYTDNYYVRILTGNCGDCHLRTVKKPHATDIGMVQGCKGSSHYYPYAKMNMALYCKAIEIAEHFQIIVITEYFDKPAMNIWLRREMEKLMHMPKGGLDQLSLGHERNHKDSKNAQSFQSSPPASIVKHLEQENKYDIELYEWAKTKVDALIAPFE